MLLIKNGYVIDPASGREEICDLMTDHGRIVEMGERLNHPEAEVIDATGLIVAPGLVDVHVHFRDPGFTYKEDMTTGAAAAKKGGYTTVVLMANTKPAVDSVDTLSYVLQSGAKTGIHIESCANVTMGMAGRQLTDMKLLRHAGAVGFTDDGIPILDEKIVRRAMEQAVLLDVPVSFHEEDPAYIKNNGINHGAASEYYGIGGSDRMAEITMVDRDLKLALETGAKIDIQHISTREAVELVRQAKKKGSNIHAEATPHHFTLNQQAAILYGTNAKMNPPLREEEDRQAIIQGLLDGTIDMIATDHAPHSAEEKKRPVTQAPSGIIGLETALSLGLMELVEKNGMTLSQLFRVMSYEPARLYQLDAGYLKEGGPADLIVLDTKAKWTAGEYASKACNTPFTGWTMTGKVRATVCSGNIVYSDWR